MPALQSAVAITDVLDVLAFESVCYRRSGAKGARPCARVRESDALTLEQIMRTRRRWEHALGSGAALLIAMSCWSCVLPPVALSVASTDAGSARAIDHADRATATPSSSTEAASVRSNDSGVSSIAARASSPCQGIIDAAACDDIGVMYGCDHDGMIAQQQACGTRDLCQAGLTSRRCATCVPGSHTCNGNMLMECAADATHYAVSSQCVSAALYDADNGKCQFAACAPGSVLCMGNTLSKCQVDGTAFIDTPCGSSMCNQSQARCDVCVAGSLTCDGNTVVTCNQDGQTTSRRACPGSLHCDGGSCVECVTVSDCPHTTPSVPCRAWRCVTETCDDNYQAKDGTSCTLDATVGSCKNGDCVVP